MARSLMIIANVKPYSIHSFSFTLLFAQKRRKDLEIRYLKICRAGAGDTVESNCVNYAAVL